MVVRPASADDLDEIGSILADAARRTAEAGFPNPWPIPFPRSIVEPHVARGEVFLAGPDGARWAATITLLWEDPVFWGARPPDAGYVHRLAVRSAHVGAGWGTRLLAWAASRTRARGRAYLRLDCVSANERLCAYYRDLGFREVGARTVQGWPVTLFEQPLVPAPPGPP